MKSKLILSFMLVMLLVSCVSAADWDNVQDYDEEEQILTITNALGLGETIARIQLLTPSQMNVIDRGPGIFQKVAELKFHEFDENYTNGLGGMELINREGWIEYEDREYKLKYRNTIREWDEDVYENVCFPAVINGTDTSECSYIKVGTEHKEDYEWIEFTELSELPKKNTFVGVYVDVLPNEKGEWIPDRWFGERIDVWASWNSSFEQDLSLFYNCEDEAEFYSGTHNLSAFAGSLVFDETNALSGKSCQIRSGQQPQLSGLAGEDVFNLVGEHHTWIIWWASNDSVCPGGETYPFYTDDMGTDFRLETVSSCASHRMNAGGIFGRTEAYEQNNWYMTTIVSNASGLTYFENGTRQDQKSQPFSAGAAELIFFNRDAGGTDGIGQIDNLFFYNRTLSPSEINDLWNNGASISPPDPTPPDLFPEINLTFPNDKYNVSTNAISFNYSCSDDNLVDNVTLFIDDVINTTTIRNK